MTRIERIMVDAAQLFRACPDLPDPIKAAFLALLDTVMRPASSQ
jgi:hypothetical protein